MRWSALLACALAGSLAAGCAGYHLGPTNGSPAGTRSVQVNLFQNQTPEPRLIEAVSSSLRKTLQQDGTFRLDTQGGGDLLVTGVITRFERSGLSFQPTDILTVQDYRLLLTAKITATDRRTGKIVLDREVTGRTTVRVGADLPSAERQAVPLLAADWAKQATALLVEGEW